MRFLRRVRLFLLIVWRVWDEHPDGRPYRLSVATSWEVANIIHPTRARENAG